MPIEDDIRAIADHANQELDAVHDFFTHSKIVWRSFVVLVAEGHRTVADNLATGTRIDQDELVRLAPQYTREYLATFTFRQFVSTFEVFVFDFLGCVFRYNPWQFKKCPLDFESVLRATSRDEIIADMVRKQLNELKYEQLKEWFVALESALHLGCPSADEIAALAEIKAARDILEHNAGVVNEIYCRKAGAKSRYAAGDHIEIDDHYHLESWRLIKSVVAAVTTTSLARLRK